MADYEKSYERWNDAIQKFDYYVVGVVGAGLVILIRDLEIERIDWNSSTVKAVGVLLLLISFLAGLYRLERQHMLLRLENEKIRTFGYRDRLKTGQKTVIKEFDYKTMSPEEVEALETRIDERYAIIGKQLKKT